MRLLLFSFIFLCTQPTSPLNQGSIQLTLKNIAADQGAIRIAVYNNQKDFEQQGKAVYGAVIADFASSQKEIQLPELDYGQYAIAVYQDLNNNQKLDKTLLGIPKEPYAFSNNPTVKWNTPTFAESKFQLQEGTLNMEIKLQSWSDY